MAFKSTDAYLKELDAVLQAKDDKAIILVCAYLLGQGELTQEQRLHILQSRARARFEVGHIDGSIDDYSRAIEIKPDNRELWNARGAAYYKKNYLDAALADFMHVAETSPEADIFVWLGVIKVKLEDFAGARTEFEKALRLTPDDVTTIKWHAYTCNGMDDHQTAIEDLSRALTLKPGDADLHRRKGSTLLSLDRHADAIVEFDEVLRHLPEDVDILSARAEAKEALGDMEGVLGDYDRILMLNPSHFGIRVARMWLLHKADRSIGAAEDAEKLVELYPQAPRAHLECGKLHQRLNNSKRARAYLKYAFDLAPYDRDAVTEYAGFLKDRGETEELEEVVTILKRLQLPEL